MKNDFQRLVDRELSGLCWNERMRQKVLHSLEKEDKPVKKKMTVAMALTLVMVLVGSLALAAGLMFSPRYDQLKAADDALLEAYGISDDLLPFFNRKLNEETGVVTYYGMEDLQSVTGNYIVSITDGKAEVAWTLDGMEGGWNAEKLAEINKEGVTFLIVDQDVGRSLEHSDYSYVMVKGGIVMEGPSNELPIEEVKDAYFGINKYA